jgi:hypothetical protein
VQRSAHRIGIIREGRLVAEDTVEGLRRAAPQKMEIRFRRPVDQAELSSLRGVTVTAAERPRVTLDVTSEIGPVLRVIASHDPVDLTSRPADLDELFLGFYRQSPAKIVVALYPLFKNSTSLDSLSGSTAAALFGVTGKLTSPGGWLNSNIYGNFLPLILLLLTIGYGAAALAGQDEDGTLALIAALPVRRRTIIFQKAWAMTVQALLLAATVTLCVVIGRGFQLAVSVGDTVAISGR